jgi:uncharacterized protein (TIGR00251 family)
MNKKVESRPAISVKIKVEPRSSKSGIVGMYGDALKVKLTSPPVEGKANRELVEVLAKASGVGKSDIEIVSGKSSKNKLVKITGIESIADIIDR